MIVSAFLSRVAGSVVLGASLDTASATELAGSVTCPAIASGASHLPLTSVPTETYAKASLAAVGASRKVVVTLSEPSVS